MEKKKKINGRAKGKTYELALIKEILHWFEDAVSSRSESKRTDDAGVDIMYTDPLQIQAKAVEKSINTHKILAGMPQVEGKLNLVFHKRNHQGCVVSMKKSDFYQLWDQVQQINNKVK